MGRLSIPAIKPRLRFVLMLWFHCSAAGGPSPFSLSFYGRKQNGRHCFNTSNAGGVMERSLAQKPTAHTLGLHPHATCPLNIPDTLCISNTIILLSLLFGFSLRGLGILVLFSLQDFTHCLITLTQRRDFSQQRPRSVVMTPLKRGLRSW